MLRIKPFILSIVFVFILFSNSFAHHYWIDSSTFFPKENSVLKSSFTASHTFFANDEIPDITKFKMCLVNPLGKILPLAYSMAAKDAAWADVAIAGKGSYTICAISTSPSYWSQTRTSWEAGRKNEVKGALKCGKYVKSMKTFLRCGQSSNSYDNVLGFEIEIIPQKDPTTLNASESLPVLVLFRGEPVADAYVGAIYDGFTFKKDSPSLPIETKTNAQGIATVKLPQKGKWVVFGKYEKETKTNPLADNENYRAYMMFEIK